MIPHAGSENVGLQRRPLTKEAGLLDGVLTSMNDSINNRIRVQIATCGETTRTRSVSKIDV